MKPKALDIFCGAGGATKGLQRAGFYVVGIDIKPQRRYCGDAFIQVDMLALLPQYLQMADFVWASPPCQPYSITTAMHGDRGHPRLIEQTRSLLQNSGVCYVIENVVGAPLRDPVTLCGTMFGLRVYRHRLFENNFCLQPPQHPKHTHGTTGSHRGYSRGTPMVCVAGHNFKREEGETAMGIDWMTSRAQLSQAIPPAYAEYIGRAALEHIRRRRAA